MIRPPVTLLVLFLAPFVIYFAFIWIAKGRLFVRSNWRLRTLMTLATLGLLLVFGNLLYLAQFSGAAPGSFYEPAHVKDGRVVPGRAK